MIIIQVCVGSSCYIKGSAEIVELLQNAIGEYGLEDDVVLVGSFCIGKCNRIGVTVQVDNDVFVGITKDNFKSFFEENILRRAEEERN